MIRKKEERLTMADKIEQARIFGEKGDTKGIVRLFALNKDKLDRRKRALRALPEEGNGNVNKEMVCTLTNEGWIQCQGMKRIRTAAGKALIA